jgi:hypothetical protein
VLTNDTITVIEGIGSDRGLLMNNISGNYGLYTLTPEFHCMNAPGVTYSPKNGLCTYVWPFGTPLSVTGETMPDNVRGYPNPFDKAINLETKIAGTVSLHNITGARILHQTVVAGHATISTNYLPQGSYVMIFTDNTGQIRLRKTLVKD